MKNKNQIVYSISTEDIQMVAVQEIDRQLTTDEINKIKDLIGEKIDWYGVILNSIMEKIALSNVECN
jgi:hypothetical protein